MQHHYEDRKTGKLFREKLDAHEPAYNPAHWQLLQTKLQTAHQGNTSTKWWQYAAVLLLGVSFVSSVWWVLSPTSSPNEQTSIVSTPVPSTPTSPIVPQTATTAHTHHHEATNVATDEKGMPDNITTNTTTRSNTTPQTTLLPANTTTQNPVNTTHSAHLATSTTLRPAKTNKNLQGVVSTKTIAQQTASTPNGLLSQPSNSQKVVLVTLNTKTCQPLYHDTLRQRQLQLLPMPASVPTTDDTPRAAKNNLLNFGNITVGIVAMPYLQWATTYESNRQTFEPVNKQVVGLQGGIDLSCSLTNWLSIESGVWFNQYQLSNFYTQALPFKPIYGDSLAARILFDGDNKEVVKYTQTALLLPIGLRLNVLTQQQNRVFLKGTLLNQLILNECSTYELSYIQIYPHPTMQMEKKAILQGQVTNLKDMTWASALQLQVGYERQLNDHFAFQVAPFLRLPMKTEGMNQLQNYSTGVAMQLNYGF